MTMRLTILLAAAIVALVGVYNYTGADEQTGDEQEFARDKCIENCS